MFLMELKSKKKRPPLLFRWGFHTLCADVILPPREIFVTPLLQGTIHKFPGSHFQCCFAPITKAFSAVLLRWPVKNIPLSLSHKAGFACRLLE